MRVINPNELQPYTLVAPKDEDLQSAIASNNRLRANFSRPALTPEQEAALANKIAIADADLAWLQANTPAGSVFEYLGVTHMVTKVHRPKPQLGEDAVWRAIVQSPNGQGGIHTSSFTVSDIRARIEPGYVVGPREV